MVQFVGFFVNRRSGRQDGDVGVASRTTREFFPCSTLLEEFPPFFWARLSEHVENNPKSEAAGSKLEEQGGPWVLASAAQRHDEDQQCE